MNTLDSLQFEKIVSALNNRYLACNFVAKQSRILARKLPKYTIESKLLTWILTGVPNEAYRSTYTDPDIRWMNSVLEFVDDKEVKDLVTDYYHKSVSSHHLIYLTDPKFEKYRRERCNILLRIIWFGNEE